MKQIFLSLILSFVHFSAQAGYRDSLKKVFKDTARVAGATATLGLSEVVISHEEKKKAEEAAAKQAKDNENQRRIEAIRTQVRVLQAKVYGSNRQLELLYSILDTKRDIESNRQYLVDSAPVKEAINITIKTSKEYEVSLIKLS